MTLARLILDYFVILFCTVGALLLMIILANHWGGH